MYAPTRAALAATAVAWLAMPADGQSPTGAPGRAPTPAGMQKGVIRDPVLNMDAYIVTYPANWHFQGVLSQGTQCQPTPSQVFRVSSPDGLTVLERMPPLGWNWGNAPSNSRPQVGCLPLQEKLSAQDFLKYLAAILQVAYVSDESIPPEVLANFQKNTDASDAYWANKYRANGMAVPTHTAEMAAANVRFKNGSYTMLGRLWATVNCSGGRIWNYQNLPWVWNKCGAAVRYAFAPEAQFQALITKADSIYATIIPEWDNAWSANLQRQTQQNIESMRAQNAAWMAMQQRQNDQFRAQMQQGTDMSIAQAAAIADRQHTIASDWVDYALGQQTVRDPNTGQLAKVPSASTYTWRNPVDNTAYQTSDPNANPNGSIPGTWSRQTQVHGDGTPAP